MRLSRHVYGGVIALAGLAVWLAPLARAQEASGRYVVVYTKDYANKETFTVMDEAEYRSAAKAARSEGAILRRALTDARREWKEQEEKRVGGKKSMADYLKQNQANRKQKTGKSTITFDKSARPRSFPSLDINMAPAFRCLALCGSREEADTKCAVLEANAAGRSRLTDGNLPNSRLKKPASSDEGGADVSRAMALFETHLERARREAEHPRAGTASRAGKRLGGPIESIIK